MSSSRIWLSCPHMGGGEQKFIEKAFATNWIAPLGPNVIGLERDLEEYLFKNKVSVAVLSSGTAAIHLGLVLLGVTSGDEVICQSMTFAASVNPIFYQGATPVFVDSELDTWNLCPTVLEGAIKDRIVAGKKPKAIIAVHLYGVPYQIEAVRAIADSHQIPILEDAAAALGSSYKGQKCGTFGDIGVLSFNGNKIITTSGGGAIVTPTAALKQKAVFYATQSRDDAPHYQHSAIGYNYRMSNICAGIGRGQMEVLDAHVVKRRAMHDFYVDFFQNYKGISVFTIPNEDYFANYWLSAIVVDPFVAHGLTRETLRLALEAENIESRPLWKPMHLQPIFEKYPYYGGTVSESLFDTGLCMPSGSNLSDADRERITKVLTAILEPFYK
jgi:dTDP-4-amino-4,6-dideoxygalactose transaminase